MRWEREAVIFLVVWLCSAALGFLGAPVAARAEPEAGLTASEPIVLNHPAFDERRKIKNSVLCVIFTRDGALLATGGNEGVVRIWDVSKGEERRALKVEDRGVDALALDPRGAFLVAGGSSGGIKIWDTRTWKEIRTLGPTSGAVRGLSISPDGKLLASASPKSLKGKEDKEFGIILWDLATGKKLRTLPLESPSFGTTGLCFTPDGKRLVSGQDRTIRVWNPGTGKETKTAKLQGVVHTLGSFAFRGDGRRMVTGIFEPKLRIWDTESWKQVREWNAHEQGKHHRNEEGGVVCVGYSPDGKYVLSGGMDGHASVWEASSGKRLLRVKAGGGRPTHPGVRWVTDVAMSPDGKTLAASHIQGTATIWRITAR